MSQYVFIKCIFGHNMGIYKFPMTEIPASKCMCILNCDIYDHINLQRDCIDLHFDQ